MTPARWQRADAAMRSATGRVFTGAVLRVEAEGQLAFESAYGATRAHDGVPVYVDTRFDLASLTKPFVATLALQLVASGRLTLDDSLAGTIPEWRESPHAAITLRMLLAHHSGMHSGADYRTILDRNVERFAVQRELAAAPGERVIYSDLGFIVLGVLVARASSCALPVAMRDAFAAPSLQYAPRASLRRAIPATEADQWRGRVQGTVHDEKAHLMGGVAGHAGLFASARDVAAMTQWYLGAACGRSTPLAAQFAREAVVEQAPDPLLRRGLGWALKTRDDNSCGRWFDRSSFGHTGFVGTCVWADPTRDLLAVLLTNSVYFGRSDTREFRAAVYDAVAMDFDRRSPA